MIEPGKVYLVGAGPGDLGLVTVKAKALIETCDVLVYDYLANPALTAWTKRGCELIYVGKQPNHHAIPQEEIENILVEKAHAGKSVVRLKGGDPFIFGRGGEEAERLAKDGLPFELVPGVTAALGSAAYTGLPLTHRDYSSSVCFLTGHENPEKHTPRIDFKKAATAADTLCIYMGMGQLPRIAAELIEGGRDKATPVAVVQWATLPRQRSLVSTLNEVAQAVETAGLGAPAVVIVGEAATRAETLGWFESRQLFGKRIVVTRNRERAGELTAKLTALGAEVLELPLIKVDEAPDGDETDGVFRELHAYQWVIFTSANGVRYFFDKFNRRFKDLRDFGGMRIACVGKSTAAAVEAQRLMVDFVPEKATAEELAEGLLRSESLEHQNVLVVSGNRNRDALVKGLETGLAIVDVLPVYRTELSDLREDPAAADFREHGADVLTFTSASAVEGFAAQARNLQMAESATRPKAVSIGPQTSAAMKAKGIPVDAEAATHNLDGLVEAIIKLLG